MQSAPPYIEAVAKFRLPFDLWPFQQDAVNALAPRPRAAYYAEVGTGKTAMSTVHANYHLLTGQADSWVVTVPPILVRAWTRWLQRIPGLNVLAYEGDPRERAKLRLEDAFHYYVMSLPIFKRDFGRVQEAFRNRRPGLLVDEATAIKNIESANYQYTRDFSVDRSLLLLTATPLATPEDAYSYIKLVAPGVYRNKRSFDNLHVKKRDFFDRPVKWNDLDLLHENMKINSCRLLKAECLPDLPQPIYNVIPYELSEKHWRLYQSLGEEQLVELENGGKIDATSVSKLFNCLQQVILNWDYFSQEESNIAAGWEVLDQTIEELNARSSTGKKLIVFANYRMTMRRLAARYADMGVHVLNGDSSRAQKERALDEFVNDSNCRMIGIQPKAGGYGVDGLQDVSSDVLFLECPSSPIELEQAVGRVYRLGQRIPPNIRIAVAERTIQVRLHKILLKMNELTNFVQGGVQSLRDALYGEAA